MVEVGTSCIAATAGFSKPIPPPTHTHAYTHTHTHKLTSK